MAEEGGQKMDQDAVVKELTSNLVHSRMTDAGQFSFAALCALCLRKLFDDDWNREFNKETLKVILNGLQQPKQVQEAIQAMYEGQGQDDMAPFVDHLLEEDPLKDDASPVIQELIGFAIAQGSYDARLRVMIKHIAKQLNVGVEKMEEIECELAETLIAHKYQMSEEEKAEQVKKAKRSKYKRFALIGLATVTGGTLIGLTGGLAAPLVAAGAGAIIGGAGAAALGSVAGVAIIGSLFGVAGAGLTGYKMKKRMGAIEEFEFEPLISEDPLKLRMVREQLHITIAITGWINTKMQDFKKPWRCLTESQEQYALRWESRYLTTLGQALDYIFNTAVSMATSEMLKYTVLSSIMAAIAWPATLLSVSNVIDNPWSVGLQRAVATGRQLAEVLLAREQGNRPVTLIGYSLGGRVIFYCLEEMAKRKGCEGIVENVVILGAPVPGDPKSWSSFRRVVSGRIVNGYCSGDWLLKFLYRTSSIQLNIAGLRPVALDNHRMTNIDLSEVVTGHMDYMKKLETILPTLGIRVRKTVKVEENDPKKLSSFSLSTYGKSSPTKSTTSIVSAATTPGSESPSETEKKSMDGGENGASSGDSSPRGKAEKEDEKHAAHPSLGGRLKNFFHTKKGAESLEQEERQLLKKSVNENLDKKDEIKDLIKERKAEVGDGEKGKKNAAAQHKPSKKNAAAAKVDSENNLVTADNFKEKERRREKEERKSGKKEVGHGQMETLSKEQLSGKGKEENRDDGNGSGDDTYTSSDPCSSPEEELVSLQKGIKNCM
ncbi:transmembrane and coiled-coil domain-containing protein 4-like [Littorina saxatilis]|uniref:transmembrane and coiled-coil domain-containing protein 4-like n=1 Tax=Littorina saxatilis TaxID=31220 RepID=UPI0038B4FA86